jgi:hypothetical protein
VTSAPHPLLDPEINVVPLGSLAAALLASSQLATLYVAPVGHRPVADEALAATMQAPRVAERTAAISPRSGRPDIGPHPDRS